MLAILRAIGIDAPPAYCPNNSILLNMNRGKGITVVKPLRTIKLAVLWNTGMSGCLAYVISNALFTLSSTKSMKLRVPAGRTACVSFNKSRILPLLSTSMRSMSHSRRDKRSSSPKNAPRRMRYSCKRLGVFNKSTPSSSAVSTVSPTPPLPRPVSACISLMLLNIRSY